MTESFGPQLIGQTEKTLQALLRQALALELRGLIANDTPTASGRAMVAKVLAKSAALSGPIWDDIDDADAAAHALTVVLTRARAALGDRT